MSDVRDRLRARLQEAEQQLADLGRVHAEIVAASRDSNADDEHDPEGATIAFERQQVAALLERARRRLADVDAEVGRAASRSAPIARPQTSQRP